MKITYSLLLISILLTSCINISNFDRGSFLPANNEPIEIEFDIISDLIIIKAEINGVSGKFLLDNGFSLSAVNKDFAQRAHIDFGQSSNIRDANNKQASIPESTVDSVIINNQSFLKTGFYQINTDAFLPCNHIDGIIGASIINKANWKINFEDKKIQISSIPFNEKGNKLAISFSNNNSSFTSISILGIPYKCKIDLGSASSIKINKSHTNNSFDGLLAEKRIGITSLSSNGLGNIDTIYHLSDKLPLTNAGNTLPIQERITLKDKLKYQGYIGINYLNNYELIINSMEKEYILISSKDKLPATIDSSYGIAIYPINDIWKIIQIDPYDAALSTIKLMDEVHMIDHLSINRFEDICDYKAYLEIKIEKKEALVLSIKGNSRPITLPFRKSNTQKIPIYKK